MVVFLKNRMNRKFLPLVLVCLLLSHSVGTLAGGSFRVREKSKTLTYKDGEIVKIDHTWKWGKVKNQQDIGSCHAFAAIALLEAAYFKHFKMRKTFSEAQFMQHWMRNKMPYSYIDDVADILKQGVCQDSFWPYSYETGTINEKAFNELAKDRDNGPIENYLDVYCPVHEEEMQADKNLNKKMFNALTYNDIGPVDKEGLIDLLSCNPVGISINKGTHAVVVAGYDKETDHFIIRNSGYRMYKRYGKGDKENIKEAKNWETSEGTYDLVSSNRLISSVGDAGIIYPKGTQIRGCR